MVCPASGAPEPAGGTTSLVGNWRREAGRFVPDLKLLVLHGSDRRRRFPEICGHHLVVTAYLLLNRDHEALFDRDCDIGVLDEAQAVKNPVVEHQAIDRTPGSARTSRCSCIG